MALALAPAQGVCPPIWYPGTRPSSIRPRSGLADLPSGSAGCHCEGRSEEASLARLEQSVEQVPPLRIHIIDQRDLPGLRTALICFSGPMAARESPNSS